MLLLLLLLLLTRCTCSAPHMQGATGFLGIFLVEELLKRTPATTRIACLVRVKADDAGTSVATANAAALARVRRTRLAAGLPWDDVCEARIEGIAGDLSKPRLGLR